MRKKQSLWFYLLIATVLILLASLIYNYFNPVPILDVLIPLSSCILGVIVIASLIMKAKRGDETNIGGLKLSLLIMIGALLIWVMRLLRDIT
jgi:undecaprenyl pyrophosphate phosphatase UppP